MSFDKLLQFMLWCLAIQSTVAVGSLNPDSSQEAYIGFRKVQAKSNSSIITKTFLTDSLLQCSSVCMQRRSCSLYFSDRNDTCNCNYGIDNSSTSADSDAIIYGEMDYKCETSPKRDQTRCPRDCLELYDNGRRTDGVYVIHPVGGTMVTTWCDMTNGGWTVFQRRQDGSESFQRNWTDYRTGFGNRCGEYWLGLNNINLLTTEPSELYIYLETFGDVSPTSAYAKYSSFSVGNASTHYSLFLDGFAGSNGDSLSYHSNAPFSTFDVDNDGRGNSCVTIYGGSGWWYKNCHHSNLNGDYLKGNHSHYGAGVSWSNTWGRYYSLKKTEMRLRRQL